LTGWVASLSDAEADNWEICRQDAWFGTGSPRGLGVRLGDELFMWRSKEGLFAYCIVTEDARRVTADSYVPWPHREKYRFVWPIDIIEERTQALHITWTQLDQIAGLGRIPASQLPPISEEKTPLVRALFDRSSEERLVRIGAGDALRQDLRRIDSEYDARVLVERAIRIRQGQGRFRAELLAAYERRCAITDCRVEAVLEAAHITPYRGEKTNRVWNGLLLRADIHTLFDLERVTVMPDLTFKVDPALAETEYGRFANRRLRVPATEHQVPSPEVLREHNERCGWLSIEA
jgi:putative restriction endonuclease